MADQLAAAQTPASPEPSPQQVQSEQGGDCETRADAAAAQGSIADVARHTGAQPEVGLEGRDPADAVDVNAAVRAEDRHFPVGIEQEHEHGLGEKLGTHEVPIVFAGSDERLPGRAGQAGEDDDNADPPAKPQPCPEPPRGDPEAAPGVAPHAGHDEASAAAGAGRLRPPAPSRVSPTRGGPAEEFPPSGPFALLPASPVPA